MRIFIFVFLFLLKSIVFAQNKTTSTREIKITKRYLNIPVESSLDRQNMIISSKENLDRKFVIRLADEKEDYWVSSDMNAFLNKKITIRFPENRKGLSKIYQSDEMAGAKNHYKEAYRPQFHYTTKIGWTNDLNGLVYYDGEYHMFYQHNPYEIRWENMHWAHAVSTDLIHWEEIDEALFPDQLGTMFSGSAVVDYKNTSGFKKGKEDVLVAIYTAHIREDGKGEGDDIQTQCLAYSNDKGRSWEKYEGNPVINSRERVGSSHTRDPKVFWHSDTNKWVMVLFEKLGISFYTSDNLKDWNYESHTEGFWECPELFELAIDGDLNNKKWVLYGVSGTYMIGSFDGKKFTPESGKHRYLSGNTLSAQTFNNIPKPDGRRIQMAWGRLYHDEKAAFSQMMTFPTELTLKKTEDGVRMFSYPIKEIEQLYKKSHQWDNLSYKEANDKFTACSGDLFHVKMNVEFKEGKNYRLNYNGNTILDYNFSENKLNGNFFDSDSNTIMMEFDLLIDKTSVEIFVDKGRFTHFAKLPKAKDQSGFQFSMPDWMELKIHKLEIHELNSIWTKKIPN